MSAFVDKDSAGNISIMEMPVEEAEVLLQALRFFFESKWLRSKTPEEREIKRLMNDIEGIIYPF